MPLTRLAVVALAVSASPADAFTPGVHRPAVRRTVAPAVQPVMMVAQHVTDRWPPAHNHNGHARDPFLTRVRCLVQPQFLKDLFPDMEKPDLDIGKKIGKHAQPTAPAD